MWNSKKWMGIVAATAVLTTLAPAGASADGIQPPTNVEKAEKVAPHATDQILVKMKSGKDAKMVAKKHGAGNVESLGTLVDTKLIKVPAGKAQEFVEKFAKDEDVEYAELDYVITATPNDPSYGSQYHLTRIQANLAWDIHSGTSGATIAVIDTGVDLDHPDLAAKIVAGYDFVYNDTVADDDHGHGTHCAGIAAADGNNSIQGTGVSWGARIMPIKVMNASGSGTTSNVIKGIDFARTNGAHIALLSFGGGGSYSQTFQTAITNAWNAGMVLTAGAGDMGTNQITYPANYANVISVAATTSTDAKASFSNYGTWVDVAAPGSSIYSTARGGGMTTMSGTAQAASVVAGLAALLRTKNPVASNASLQSRIFNTADAISGTGSYWIYGRVNAYKAVNGF